MWSRLISDKRIYPGTESHSLRSAARERRDRKRGRERERERKSNIVSLTSPHPASRGEIQFYFLLAYRAPSRSRRPHCGSEFAERARWKRPVFPRSPSILSRPLQCAIFIPVGSGEAASSPPLNNTTRWELQETLRFRSSTVISFVWNTFRA